MSGRTVKAQVGTALRRRAEEIANQQGNPPPKTQSPLSREEAVKLVYELRVHQIELQMQNDELFRAQADLNAARERYFDLYNLAPVGYFIVSHDGRILETNLAGTNLLGVPRAALVKRPIAHFILKEDQDIYYLHRRQLLATGQAHSCEVRMVKADGTAFWVRLAATSQTPLDGPVSRGTAMSRVVLSDISEQKQIEQAGGKGCGQRVPAQRRPMAVLRSARDRSGKKAGKIFRT